MWRPSVCAMTLRRGLRDVVALADVVEEVRLHHHVVDAELAGLDDADACGGAD